MTTDATRKKFETLFRGKPRGPIDQKEIDRAWLWFCMGHAQGQRDLIEALGEPVAWQSDVKSPFAAVLTASHFNGDLDALYRHGNSTGMIPLYRLPEDAPKPASVLNIKVTGAETGKMYKLAYLQNGHEDQK